MSARILVGTACIGCRGALQHQKPTALAPGNRVSICGTTATTPQSTACSPRLVTVVPRHRWQWRSRIVQWGTPLLCSCASACSRSVWSAARDGPGRRGGADGRGAESAGVHVWNERTMALNLVTGQQSQTQKTLLYIVHTHRRLPSPGAAPPLLTRGNEKEQRRAAAGKRATERHPHSLRPHHLDTHTQTHPRVTRVTKQNKHAWHALHTTS